MFALHLNEDGHIHSAWKVLPNGVYEDMPIVEELPDGDIAGYRYMDGEFNHDPLPVPEQPEAQPTQEERIAALEKENKQLKEALDLLLSGATEEAGETDG